VDTVLSPKISRTQYTPYKAEVLEVVFDDGVGPELLGPRKDPKKFTFPPSARQQN